MVVGTAGPNPSMNIQIPQPSYTEKVSFEHGAAHITVHNATSLHWRFLKNGDRVVKSWMSSGCISKILPSTTVAICSVKCVVFYSAISL